MTYDTNYQSIKTKHGDLKLPCMTPYLVDINLVKSNDYNPNSVSSKNMDLLLESILQNGFCFPVVVIWSPDEDSFIIIDGFHRYTIFKDYLEAKELPVVILDQEISERMTATVQFNRARGVHGIEPMVKMVKSLLEQGMAKEDIMTKLGMEVEELDRLASVGGIAEIFKNVNYSTAFTMVEFDDVQ